jgi:hypothetical protein
MRIGIATLIEATEVTEHYEVAAWYRKIRIEAGHTAVINMHAMSCYWSGCVGTITDAYFPALFGGVAMTSGRRPEDIGKPAEWRGMSAYAYEIAEAVALHGGRFGAWQIELDPDAVEIVPVEFEGRTHYSLRVRKEQN